MDLCVTVVENDLRPFGGIAAHKPFMNMGSAVTEVGSASTNQDMNTTTFNGAAGMNSHIMFDLLAKVSTLVLKNPTTNISDRKTNVMTNKEFMLMLS